MQPESSAPIPSGCLQVLEDFFLRDFDLLNPVFCF